MATEMEIEPIERIEWLLGQLDKLSKEAAELRAAVERLPSVERDFEAVKKKVFDAMKTLDITNSGNAGFEARIVAFLVKLRRTTAGRNAG